MPMSRARSSARDRHFAGDRELGDVAIELGLGHLRRDLVDLGDQFDGLGAVLLQEHDRAVDGVERLLQHSRLLGDELVGGDPQPARVRLHLGAVVDQAAALLLLHHLERQGRVEHARSRR
jgi:hypothetical protein